MPDTTSSVLPSDQDLYANLGRQLVTVRATTATEFGVESLRYTGPGLPDDFAGIGKEYFQRISGEAYKAICEGGATWQTIENATQASLVTAFAALIIAHLAIAAVVATAVASLIVGIFFKATGSEICAEWHNTLPAAP